MDIYVVTKEFSSPQLGVRLNLSDTVGHYSSQVIDLVGGTQYSSQAFYDWVGSPDSFNYLSYTGSIPDPSSGGGGGGAQGYQGVQGFRGFQGVTGPQGSQGLGTQGNQGVVGIGNQGVQGNQGNIGPQGNQGVQGVTGSQGAVGTQGHQGFQGNIGVGTQGFQGVTGSGSPGVTGSQGFQGPLGSTGSQGVVGLQGSTGSQGVGLQGVQGSAGGGLVVTPLTYAATLNTDASTGNLFRVTLTGNVTLANPTNATDGKAITWEIKQDGVGSRTVTLGSKFVIPTNATTPLAWSTAANAMDILAVRYNAGADKFYVLSMVGGY